MHPTFLRQSVEGSLERLNLQCLDICYIHNFYEAQAPFNTDNVVFDRLAEAYETMEKLVQEGKIRHYGIATYSSLRQKPGASKMHLNVQKVARIAEKVGGDDHKMRYVQVPVNMLMPEAFIEPWQEFEDKEGVKRNKILVGCLTDLKLNLITSQPLAQGLISRIPLSRLAVPDVYNLPARHIQFVRSIPSRCLVSTVVGMKKPDHVRQNLEVIKQAPMTRQDFLDVVKPVRRHEFIEESIA